MKDYLLVYDSYDHGYAYEARIKTTQKQGTCKDISQRVICSGLYKAAA